jgi:hypothetical protein
MGSECIKRDSAFIVGDLSNSSKIKYEYVKIGSLTLGDDNKLWELKINEELTQQNNRKEAEKMLETLN